MGSVMQDDIRALADELGIPSDLIPTDRHFPAGYFDGDFAPYEFHIVGLDLPLPPIRPPWPFIITPDRPDRCLQAWLQAARYKDDPLQAELRWHPVRGPSLSIYGLEQRHSMGQLGNADKAAQLLLKLATAERPGPKPGSGMFADETTDTMREKVITAMVSLLKSHRSIAQPSVAKALHCSEKTLRDALRELGLQGAQWTAMQTEAQRRHDGR